MASRFWVGGTGTWDGSSTTHWAATTGGASGASVPGATDTVTLDGNSGGGIITVNTNFSIISLTMGAFTGTLDFSTNNNSPTLQTFNNSGTATRTLNMGSGTWSITGNAATVWNSGTTTGLTFNAGTSNLNFTYSGATGTRTISPGSALIYYNFSITAGSDTVSQSVGLVTSNNFSTVGFTGIYNKAAQSLSIGGNFTLGSGSTWTSTGSSVTLTSSSTSLITTNGVNINQNITINGTGIFTLAGNIDITGTNITTFTVTLGTFTTNNFNLNASIFNSNNGNTRTINMGSSIFTLVGTGGAWNTTNVTGLTLNPGTSTILINNASATIKTFASGNMRFNNLTFDGIGTGIFMIGNGANTLIFNNITVTNTAAHTVQFFSGSIIIANTLTWSGTVSNLITFQSNNAGSPYFLNINHTIVSLDYVSFQDAQQIGDSRFFAGIHSTNVSGNQQIIFTAPTQITGPFPTFFRQS